jgi:hypothetical protein
MFEGRNDTQNNDIQLNDIEGKGFSCDTQHKRHPALQNCHCAGCRYAERRITVIVILNVIMLSVYLLSVALQLLLY